MPFIAALLAEDPVDTAAVAVVVEVLVAHAAAIRRTATELIPTIQFAAGAILDILQRRPCCETDSNDDSLVADSVESLTNLREDRRKEAIKLVSRRKSVVPLLQTLAACLMWLVASAMLQPSEPNDPPAGGALAGQRPRVIISSDIGGNDPDDKQSFAHLLVYADVLDIEGMISSPPGKGRVKDIQEVLDAYEKDYSNLKTHSTKYPQPEALRALAKQGATDAWGKGDGVPTEGSRWIIRQAKQDDVRPLYVLVFGSITDVAQALKDEPSIKQKLRVYFIASWNRKMDERAFAYVDRNHPDLWLIRSETTFRGMYLGGDQAGDLANDTFSARHVRGHGALGDYFWAAKKDIKMGDTPAVLYLLRGDPADPTGPHWGGRYIPHPERATWWVDDPDRKVAGPGGQAGAATVSQWRAQYLRDWQQRMARCLEARKDEIGR